MSLDFIDISLEKSEDGTYDIFFTSSGDIATENSFDSPLIMSIFEESRADSSQVQIPELRRGWWGNLINGVDDFEFGSKLWLLDQARIEQKTLNEAEDFTRTALQWFINDGLIKSVDVSAEFSSTQSLMINVVMNRFNAISDSRLFDAWENTGNT